MCSNVLTILETIFRRLSQSATDSLQCRRILGGPNPFRVRIVVAAIFDDTYASKNICAPEENACTAGNATEDLKTCVQICYVDFE